jgi:hypothetical protein
MRLAVDRAASATTTVARDIANHHAALFGASCSWPIALVQGTICLVLPIPLADLFCANLLSAAAQSAGRPEASALPAHVASRRRLNAGTSVW